MQVSYDPSYTRVSRPGRFPLVLVPLVSVVHLVTVKLAVRSRPLLWCHAGGLVEIASQHLCNCDILRQPTKSPRPKNGSDVSTSHVLV